MAAIDRGSPRWRIRVATPRTAAIIGLFVVAAAYSVLVEFHRSSIPANDIYGSFLPNTVHALQSVHDGGRGLLWNPFQSCGTPFFANTGTGLLYPPHLLFLFLSLDSALHAVLVIDMVIGALGMLLLLRQIGLGWTASVGGALAFQLGDPLVQLLSWGPAQGGTWTWMPWALLFCERLLRGPSLGGVIGLTIALAFQFLPGFVLIAALTYQLIALRVLWEVATCRSPRPWRGALAVAAGLILAPLLVAVQLVPAAEFAGQSMRTAGGFLWSQRIGLAEIPEVVAARQAPVPFFVAGLLLASVGVLAPSARRLAVFYLLTGTVFAVLALGDDTPLYALYGRIPHMTETVRSPFRLFWVTGFCLSMLVALALHAIAHRGLSGAAASIAPLVATLLAAGLFWMVPGGLRWDEVISLGGIVVALTVAALRPKFGPLAAWVIVAAVLINLIGTPIRWPGSLQPSADVIWRNSRALDKLPTADYRALFVPSVHATLQLTLTVKTATVLRLPDFGEFEGLLGDRMWSYLVAISRGTPPGSMQRRLLDAASIRYLVVSPALDLGFPAVPTRSMDLQVYRNDTALPRARFVPRIDVVRDPSALLERLATGDDDLAQVAFVENELSSGFRGGAGPPQAGTARFLVNDPEHLVIEVDAPQHGFLMLADQYYPGWRATVNGTETPIALANHMFRLVEVPAGTSRVEFRYRPRSLVVGAAISATTAAGLGLALVWSRRRRAREAPGIG